MDPQDNIAKETSSLNAQGQMRNGENIGSAFGPISGAHQSPNALGNVKQDIDGIIRGHDERLTAFQVAHHRACNDYNQATSGGVLQQDMNSLLPPTDAPVAYYEDNSAYTDATPIQQQRVSYGSSQVQQFGSAPEDVQTYASAFNNTTPYVQLLPQQMGTPVNTTSIRLMHIRGHVAAFCADANGSRFIQQAIEVATTEEIVMVYDEITPCCYLLSKDVSGNHAIQKILNHGPQLYKRLFINHMMGHVCNLSLHMYGCRVIQKVFDIAEQDQKVDMAKELSNNVLIYVCDKFANFVIQKCIEHLPSKHIKFIFQSIYGKAAALSTDPYGWHVVKKVLAHCHHNPEIHHITAEIIEFAEMLSADQYGNYVVQHLVEHGSPIKRSMMLKKFSGQFFTMSYHKHASNVIDKCLTFGCHHDRQLIVDKIIGGNGGGHQHLMDMMMHPYAYLVIQKMVVMAEDEDQIGVLVDVVRSNIANLKMNQHGRHVIASMEKFLTAKARMMDLPVSSPLLPQ